MRRKINQGYGGKESPPPRLQKDRVPQPPHGLENAALISFLIHILRFSLGQKLSRCTRDGGAHCHRRSPPRHPGVCLSCSQPQKILPFGVQRNPPGRGLDPHGSAGMGNNPQALAGSGCPPAANIPIFHFSGGFLGFGGDMCGGHTQPAPKFYPQSLGPALVTHTRRSLLLFFRAIKR